MITPSIFNKNKYTNAATPTQKGNVDVTIKLTKYKYKKNANAPVSITPTNAYMAPGRNVFVNCNLLIKQAIRTTIVAIVNGIGNVTELVSTYWFVSMQWVPFVSNPLGHRVRQAPLWSEYALSQFVQKSADEHLWQLDVEHLVHIEFITTA